MGSGAEEPPVVGIRLSGPSSFGLIRRGWYVRVKDMERGRVPHIFKSDRRAAKSFRCIWRRRACTLNRPLKLGAVFVGGDLSGGLRFG